MPLSDCGAGVDAASRRRRAALDPALRIHFGGAAVRHHPANAWHGRSARSARIERRNQARALASRHLVAAIAGVTTRHGPGAFARRARGWPYLAAPTIVPVVDVVAAADRIPLSSFAKHGPLFAATHVIGAVRLLAGVRRIAVRVATTHSGGAARAGAARRRYVTALSCAALRCPALSCATLRCTPGRGSALRSATLPRAALRARTSAVAAATSLDRDQHDVFGGAAARERAQRCQENSEFQSTSARRPGSFGPSSE